LIKIPVILTQVKYLLIHNGQNGFCQNQDVYTLIKQEEVSMKLVKTTIAATFIAGLTALPMTSANAWWGGGPWDRGGYDDWGSDWGPFDSDGDFDGDFDMGFHAGGRGSGRGHGYGRGYGYNRGYYGYGPYGGYPGYGWGGYPGYGGYAPYGYAPAPAAPAAPAESK
jgi:hypothetical protein